MIHKLNDISIAVEVPEGSWNFQLYEELLTKCIGYLHSFKEGKAKQSFIYIPAGNWEILGRPASITEEQAKGIIEQLDNKFQIRYQDYYLKEKTKYTWEKELKKMGFVKALSSFESLLTSKNVPKESVIILIKKQ